ncbi:MAG: hypothetical protein OJF60_001647 [Burkholderiaceae bacterium]|jgi:DNA invertase Pin-like site-specific DNA recombinase|nr:MAG: hypothetical protein OJF60_001647 [Burkholderiaceae bacterium]
MLVGYARVSTLDQNTRLQLDALRAAGVRRVFQDKSSGVGPRPQLHRALSALRPGDQFVVWKLDRIARSLFDLLALLDRVRLSGASVRSLMEPIDTGSPYGRFTLQVLGAVAELERNIIRERIIAGQVAAIRRGVVVGGRPKLLTAREASRAKRLREGGYTWPEIGARLGVSNTTARRAVLGDNRDRMKVLRQYL